MVHTLKAWVSQVQCGKASTATVAKQDAKTAKASAAEQQLQQPRPRGYMMGKNIGPSLSDCQTWQQRFTPEEYQL